MPHKSIIDVSCIEATIDITLFLHFQANILLISLLLMLYSLIIPNMMGIQHLTIRKLVIIVIIRNYVL